MRGGFPRPLSATGTVGGRGSRPLLLWAGVAHARSCCGRAWLTPALAVGGRGSRPLLLWAGVAHARRCSSLYARSVESSNVTEGDLHPRTGVAHARWCGRTWATPAFGLLPQRAWATPAHTSGSFQRGFARAVRAVASWSPRFSCANRQSPL